METGSPTLLGQTHDRVTDVLGTFPRIRIGTSGHGKVRILIDHNNQLRQELMSVRRKEVTVLVFLVIELDVVYTCRSEKLVSLIHLDT